MRLIRLHCRVRQSCIALRTGQHSATAQNVKLRLPGAEQWGFNHWRTAMSLDLNQTWETYTASWKAPSIAEKQALFVQCLDPQCVYNDPQTAATGWDALGAYMETFHQTVPGGHFATKSFASHHQQSIATWNMLDGNGRVIGEGTSYGRYKDQGRLVAMTGFFAQS